MINNKEQNTIRPYCKATKEWNA